MAEDRAYTHIDAGTIILGNAWLERQWSAFLGNTVSLRQKAGGVAWIDGSAPEFRIHLPDRVLGHMDLGETEWSEELNRFGAGLFAVQWSPELSVQLCFFAFHRVPGLLRTMCVVNRSKEPLTVGPVALEVLPARRGDVGLHVDGHACEEEGMVSESDHPVALTIGEAGLLLGTGGGGRFELFAPDPLVCAVGTAEQRKLRPGQRWQLPSSFLAPFTGTPQEDGRRALDGFRQEWQHMRAWEQERTYEGGNEAPEAE